MALSISGTTNRQIPWRFQNSHWANTRQTGPDTDEGAPQYSRGTEVTTGKDEAKTSLQHAWSELAHCRTTTAVGWRDCRTRESSAGARKEAAEHETQDLHEHHYRVTTSPVPQQFLFVVDFASTLQRRLRINEFCHYFGETV